jgi:hypothetical protein
MSLEGLVAQVGQVLGDARSLYGAAPQGGGWSSTQALSAGRDGIATAGGVVAGWGGAASSTHLAASGGRVLALDNVVGADGATGSGFSGAADTSQSGRTGMTGVVDDTRRGVAAIAPSTDTAAGKRQLVDHRQSEWGCVVFGGLENGVGMTRWRWGSCGGAEERCGECGRATWIFVAMTFGEATEPGCQCGWLGPKGTAPAPSIPGVSLVRCARHGAPALLLLGTGCS